MSTTRYHRAAKDGATQILKQATKKDLNYPDADGMTPTLWTAYHGHLKALEICCKRQGNPNKVDYSGNSAVHLAAKNGKIPCLRFLVSFGANLWICDNDLYTPRDVAVIRNQQDVVGFLDAAMNEEKMKNPKKITKKQLEEKKEAENRKIKYEKLLQERQKEISQARRGSIIAQGTVARKAKKPASKGTVASRISTVRGNKKQTIPEEEDVTSGGGAGDITSSPTSNFILMKSDDMKELENPNRNHTTNNNTDDDVLVVDDQPYNVFGTRAFRINMTSANSMFGGLSETTSSRGGGREEEGSVGNHGNSRPALKGIFDEVQEDEVSPLESFLSDLRLEAYLDLFEDEEINMKSLMECSDADLKEIGIPLGPRKLVLKSLEEMKKKKQDEETTLF